MSRSRAAVRFATTRWSLVAAAGRTDDAERRQALEQLCEHYWTPLYAFLRQQGYDRSDAQDLTQSFLLDLLTRNTWAVATPERGRFRSFLLGCFKNYLSHEKEKQRARKRGGSKLHFSLYQHQGESDFRTVAKEPSPEVAFELAWLHVVVQRVIHRFLNQFQNTMEQAAILRQLPRILGDDDAATLSDNAVKPTAAERQQLSRLRKAYRKLLLEEVGETVLEPGQIQEEIQYLFSLASRKSR